MQELFMEITCEMTGRNVWSSTIAMGVDELEGIKGQ